MVGIAKVNNSGLRINLFCQQRNERQTV
jgi:hypothetical protein